MLEHLNHWTEGVIDRDWPYTLGITVVLVVWFGMAFWKSRKGPSQEPEDGGE